MANVSGALLANCTVKINVAGVREILNGSGAQYLCWSLAGDVYRKVTAYDGVFSYDVQPGQNRCHALVKTEDWTSRHSNLKYNALAKAMG